MWFYSRGIDPTKHWFQAIRIHLQAIHTTEHSSQGAFISKGSIFVYLRGIYPIEQWSQGVQWGIYPMGNSSQGAFIPRDFYPRDIDPTGHWSHGDSRSIYPMGHSSHRAFIPRDLSQGIYLVVSQGHWSPWALISGGFNSSHETFIPWGIAKGHSSQGGCNKGV